MSKSNRLEDTCPHMAQEGRNSPSGPSHQLLLLAILWAIWSWLLLLVGNACILYSEVQKLAM